MVKKIFIEMLLTEIISLVILAAASAQQVPPSLGATVPVNQLQAEECADFENVRFIADALNLCWYHECLFSEDGWMLMPRRCPLGSRLPTSYVSSMSNPCIVSFDSEIGYECSRGAAQDPIADCSLTCANGGTLLTEPHTGTCWCVCPADWQGEYDCSKRTDMDATPVPPTNICEDGEPLANWCELVGGCLNGGTCSNMCDTFVCNCPVPYTFGKRCERFSCSGDDECYNGGQCRRGQTGENEFRRCVCTPEYFGLQCENSVEDLPVIDPVDPSGAGRDIGK